MCIAPQSKALKLLQQLASLMPLLIQMKKKSCLLTGRYQRLASTDLQHAACPGDKLGATRALCTWIALDWTVGVQQVWQLCHSSRAGSNHRSPHGSKQGAGRREERRLSVFNKWGHLYQTLLTLKYRCTQVSCHQLATLQDGSGFGPTIVPNS